MDRVDDHGFRWSGNPPGVGGDGPPTAGRIVVAGDMITFHGDRARFAMRSRRTVNGDRQATVAQARLR